MKRYLFYLLVLVAAFVAPASAAAESIKSFDAEYVLPQSAIVEVTETIRYDFGSLNRHGIFRYIPYRYELDNEEVAYVNLSDFKVVDTDGDRYEYTKFTENDFVVLQIGDPDRTITGTHTYVISYKAKGAIRYLESGDEFFWNVNGNGWDVPVESITAEVKLPNGLAVNEVEFACYTGIYGSSQKCQKSDIDGSLVSFSDTRLASGEGLSVVISVPSGTFEVVSAGFLGSGISSSVVGVMALVALAIPVLVFFFMLRHWYKYGRDAKGKGTIIPEYNPPDGLTPIEVGTLLDGRVDNKDLSAEIIFLATQGYLRIKKEKKKFLSGSDYTLIKTKEMSKGANQFDYDLFHGIFGGAAEVKLSELKGEFHTKMNDIKSNVHGNLVQRKYFKERVASTIGKYIGIAGGVAVVGVGAGVLIGSFTSGVGAFIFIPSAIVSALIVAGFGLLMPARTEKGAITKEHILGLKEYMRVAESDRIKFHNAPEKTPEKFEQLLPYAMVLGVEKEWAKQFEDIYKGKPTWYDDPSGNIFVPLALANSLNSFNTVATQNMFSAPSSSGSGLGGGGFSGGGFGGGGGGSW